MAGANVSSRMGGVVLRFAVIALALAPGSSGAAGAPCNEPTARLVARMYVLASPLAFDEDEFTSFLTRNKAAFGRTGQATACMVSVGTKLMNSALGAAAGPRYRATERFSMPEGLEHLPGEVDRSLDSAGADTFAMAQELLWLAEVLPAAANGDFGPFSAQATIARQAWLREALPALKAICALDPSSCQLAVAAVQQALPIAEQQLYLLALQVGD